MEKLNHSKAAQLSATFSISMFLSLCVLATKPLSGWGDILIALWTVNQRGQSN